MTALTPHILIVGGTGMLGGMLQRYLSARCAAPIVATQRRDRSAPGFLDAADRNTDLERLIGEECQAQFVINAVGVLKANINESDPASVDNAVEVNSRFPHRLAVAASACGARMVHVSTDAVFAGAPRRLDEDAAADPEDVYGRSKLDGEVQGARAITLRCSIVGPDPANGRSLYEWLRRQPAGGTVSGFVDQQWNGVTTLQVAKLCEALQAPATFDAVAAASPLRHYCPNPALSKYELLCQLRDALGLDVAVEPSESGAAVDRTLTSRWTDLNSLTLTAGWSRLLSELVDADPRGRVAQPPQ